MFQRIRGAIDRSLADELARQKTSSDQGGSSAAPSASSPHGRNETGPGRPSRIKKPSGDPVDAAPNPDPAVFEAAFVIDDSDDPSRAGTPKPTLQPAEQGKDSGEGSSSASRAMPEDSAGGSTTIATEDREGVNTDATGQGVASPSPELDAEMKQKLRKLDKLEATYPELLRSYRVAHKRATSIEPFEKALRENTPLTSIGDPDALVEYLNQINLRGDMVMEELKRVSADKEDIRKKHEEAQASLAILQTETEALRAAQAGQGNANDTHSRAVCGAEGTRTTNSSATSVVSARQKLDNDEGAAGSGQPTSESFFSFDDEIPQLQAELASKSEQIDRLQSEAEKLKGELSVVKETSAGLVQSLENATRELGESRDAAASQDSLQTQLDARNTDIATLKKELGQSQVRLKHVEAQALEDKTAKLVKIEEAASSEKRAKELGDEVTKAATAKAVSSSLIGELSAQVEILKREKSEVQSKIEDMTRSSEPTQSTGGETMSSQQPLDSTPAAASTASKKRNNRKKKGKGGAIITVAAQAGEDGAAQGARAMPSPAQNAPANSNLQTEISRLQDEVAAKDEQIERLTKKRQAEEDLREEIETLKDDLVHIGQGHVEAKERIGVLEAEKAALTTQILELEEKMKASSSGDAANTNLQGDLDALQKELEELRNKSAMLQSDLGAAQSLAQSRFKDLAELREILEKAQPELKSLRQESEVLKSTKDELTARSKELKEAEKKEQELKRELHRAQQHSSDGESEIKGLKAKLGAESETKARLEEVQRLSVRDAKLAETEKSELGARADKAERELQKTREEVSKLKSRVKELEDLVNKLGREKAASQEEAEFKTQQYTNAQGLLSSMRDQTTEMSVQLKESKSQAESLEEELAEVQRLLQERTREGETMRRLLADVDGRADSKVRDMRVRMEAAVEERERLEDESSTLARRKAREAEELRQRIRELEREVKTLGHERDELEELERGWRRRREELDTVEAKAEAEAEEMRSTVSQLRSALDASEGQVRDAEKQRADLRKMLDDSRQRYEKVARDLKGTQARLAANSSRSSTDSNRSGMNGSPGGSDMTYLKTILLQFLEQKDSKLRTQLVPVLGKLLKFDRTDEQKWMNAVQRIEVR